MVDGETGLPDPRTIPRALAAALNEVTRDADRAAAMGRARPGRAISASMGRDRRADRRPLRGSGRRETGRTGASMATVTETVGSVESTPVPRCPTTSPSRWGMVILPACPPDDERPTDDEHGVRASWCRARRRIPVRVLHQGLHGRPGTVLVEGGQRREVRRGEPLVIEQISEQIPVGDERERVLLLPPCPRG